MLLLRGLFIGQFNVLSACCDVPNHSSFRENHKRNILISLKDDKSLTVSSIELVDYGWPGTFLVYENVDATDVKFEAVSVSYIQGAGPYSTFGFDFGVIAQGLQGRLETPMDPR